MATLHRAIELTRHGATLQRREANDMTRQAAGQGLAEAGARARGQANNDRVREQVEEELRLAELKDRSAATLDRSAKDLEARVQQLQIRINRSEQKKRELQRQVTEIRQALEGAKQEVAERRKEAHGLQALRKALRSREARCSRDDDRHNTEALKGEPPKNCDMEVTTEDGDHEASGANKEGKGATSDGAREVATEHDDYVTSTGIREVTTDHNNYDTSDGATEVTTEHDDYDAGRANPDKKAEEDKRDTGGSGKRQEDDAPGRM